MEKILILFGILVIFSQELTTQPNYLALPFTAMGKADVLSTLTDNAQGWLPYTVTFGKTLPSMTRTQATISLISFDCLTSNQFSFNTTIKSISLTSMSLMTKIQGNSYFRQLSLHYMIVSNSEIIPYIFNECFLTSELLGQKRSVLFSKIDLSSTETNRFQTISFINGLKMYNNNQNIKYIHVQSYMKPNQSLIFHNFMTQGKTLVQQICIGVIVMDAKYRVTFSTLNSVYQLGKAQINYNDPVLDWAQVPEVFNAADMMFFGLSSLRLGSGKQNTKLFFHSQRTVDFKQDAQVISFGGEISFFFMADHQCLDLTTPYFNLIDQLCYNLCPISTYNQDLPVKNCYSCHYSCLTCTGKLQTQCLSCQSIDFRIINSTQCSCITGYVDIGIKICEKCSNLMNYCLECNSYDNCTKCDFGLIFDPLLKQCICLNNDYFVSLSSICVPYPGCQQAQTDGSLKCQKCNNLAYFIKDPNTQFCICQQYYEKSQQKCIEKCGDGINLRQNDLMTCDDGNKIDGDGCSSKCLIEAEYGCVNKVNDISTCSLLGNFTLQYLYSQRIPGENSAIIVIKVVPFIKKMNDQDFIFTLETSIPHNKMQITTHFQYSLIKIKIDYLETIQGSNQNLTIGFDKRKLFASGKVINFDSNGINLQLTYDSNIRFRNILNIITKVISGVILLVFIILCFLQQKMAGTQLLLSCQLVYFTIFSIGNNSAIDGLNGLKYLVGFNDVYNFQLDPNNFQVFYILSMKCYKQYILNFNVMVGFQILSFLLIFPFKLRIWDLQKTKQKILNYEIQENIDQNGQMKTISQTKKKIYEAEITLKKYLNRFYYPISLICQLPSIFYFSVQVISANLNNKIYLHPALNLLVSSLSLILSCGFLVFLHQQSSKKRPMFTFFRNGIFYPFYLVFLYFGVVLAYSMVLKYSFAFFTIFTLQIGILVFRILNKPYPRYGTIKAIDSLAKHAITLICMILLFASKFFTKSAEGLFVVIPVLLLINLTLTLVRCFKGQFLKKRKNSGQIDLLNKQNDQNQNNNDQKDSQKQSSSQNSQPENNKNKQNKQIADSGQVNQQGLLKSSEQQKNNFINKNVHENSQSDEDEDQLTKIKRRLRKDLRQKRGVINSQVNTIKKKKINSQ